MSWLETLNESLDDRVDGLDIPDVDITLLNEDQTFAFNIVIETPLMNFINQEQYKPLRLVVTGTAGSGKSYLIKCLVKAIRLLFQSNKSVQVVCPTGNSANLISGTTLHSFLKVPTYNRGGEMKPPDGSLGVALQENCAELKALLVDERSLIGATTLGWMEFMCGHGVASQFNQSNSWGGVPVVIFMGDDVQLPTVLDSPVYRCSSKSLAALHGVLVWNDFQTVVGLQNIIRQGNEEQVFRDVLMSLRQYKTTKEQALWLQQFQWDRLKSVYGEDLMLRMDTCGLFVLPSHEEECQHNTNRLLKVNQVHPVAKIKAVGKGSYSSIGDSEKAGGHLHTIYLCKDAQVMLTCNLNVQFGLFIGAIGKVLDIIYQNGHHPPDCFPDVVIVKFHSYTGPSFIEQDP